MAEQTELSALSNNRFYLFRIFDVGGGRLVTDLARDPTMITFFLAHSYFVMAVYTGISARVFYGQIGIHLRRGSAIMAIEAKVRGYKKIMGQGVNGKDDRQRNQEVAYLFREPFPKPFESDHISHRMVAWLDVNRGCSFSPVPR